MKVKFIESPTGVLGLAYFVGDEIEVNDEKAKLLVDGGFAEPCTPSEEVDEPEVDELVRTEKPKQHRQRRK